MFCETPAGCKLWGLTLLPEEFRGKIVKGTERAIGGGGGGGGL